MKIVKKGRYILHAPWHGHNGKEVEVIMKRKGISDSYRGLDIYHLALDPDESFRSENLDEEFVEENFRPLDEMTCVLDTSMASDEIIKKFKPYYKFLKMKMIDRINVEFVEKGKGDTLDGENHLCVFYLVDDGKGNPGLTLDKDGGEILIVEEEKQKIIKEEKNKIKKK